MPSCPECGIDVPREGLCPECREELKEHPGVSPRRRGIHGLRFLLIGGIIAAAGVIAYVLGIHAWIGPSAVAEAPDTPVAEADEETAGEDRSPGAGAAASALGAEPRTAYALTERKEHPPIANGRKEEFVQWMLERTPQDERFLRRRWDRSRACMTMYETPDLHGDRVIEAFLRTPREEFVRAGNRERAYENAALAIGYGQTISGPHMVSRMTSSLAPQPHHRVLEIGTGSGYQAAVLAQLSEHVYSIEIVRPLAEETAAIYERLREVYPEYRNVSLETGDGYYGWEEHAPFDRIIVTAGIDHIPPPLLRQLAPGGIMVIPVGPPSGQTVLKVTKTTAADGSTVLEREDVYGGTSRGNIRFVPFTDPSGRRRSTSGE